MKQRFTLFIATLFLSVCFPLTALAYDVLVDGIYYNLVAQEKTAEVTSGDNEYTGEITIPGTIAINGEEYNVASIGFKAFYNCSSLTSVTIPNSVTSIGELAFFNCSSLTSVTIPNSVTSIGNSAFYYCSSLTSVTIPNSVTSIGNGAFSGLSSLTSMSVDPNNTIYDSRDNCNAIIRTSDNTLIAGCQSTTIPNSVTSIGNGAFSYCFSLTSVTIPNSVTSIGIDAFFDCSSLTSVTIPNSVTSIGRGAFSDCSSLTSVTIPNSVTSIEDYVFERCSSLTSVTIPNSVTSIGMEAFYGCLNLTSITIGASVTSIKNMALSKCSSLTSISVDPDNTIYDSRDNCNAIIRTSDNTLIAGCQSTIIPNSVQSIGFKAFYDCSSLTSVTIPNSVTSIEEGAFAGCSSLISFTIPNSVICIGNAAFLNCSNLTSITISNSVTGIGQVVFFGCKNLEKVYCYAETVPSSHKTAFYGSNVESATLYVPASAIDSYKTTSPWSKFGTIKTLDEVEKEKCETPTIAFSDGRLTFSCVTDDVEYVSEVKCADVKTYYTAEVALTACYDISVTATKTGYENSDVATAKLYWLRTSETSDDDTNINSVSMRGIAIQTAAGFITISGLNDNERVEFYTLNGTALGATRATNGTATFSTQSGSVLIVRIGNESLKIMVE